MTKKKRGGLLDSIGDLIEDSLKGLAQQESDQPAGGAPQPITRRVSLIVHNPRVPSAGNERLNKVLGWNDPAPLVQGYIDDLHECSRGYVTYKVVETRTVNRFPRKADGFTYKADDFVNAWRTRQGFHQPDAVDYDALLDEFDMIQKVDADKVDEFWLFAFPYAGYYESIMAGPGAFWCNAPPLTQTAHASRRFVIMGSVSYTHLDVYKRQGLRCRSPRAGRPRPSDDRSCGRGRPTAGRSARQCHPAPHRAVGDTSVARPALSLIHI